MKKETDRPKAPVKTVDTYLAALPPQARAALEKLRAVIKATAPQAEEYVGYGMPGYKYHGSLVYFAAFPNHLSFFPASRSVAKTFLRELKPFATSGTTIHFSPEKPLPAALVKKIVKARMLENELRRKKKGA
jgi:uncharacterized protein YdhG (YjbR/CyaY superfamily)